MGDNEVGVIHVSLSKEVNDGVADWPNYPRPTSFAPIAMHQNRANDEPTCESSSVALAEPLQRILTSPSPMNVLESPLAVCC